jgi:hypothetical protein
VEVFAITYFFCAGSEDEEMDYTSFKDLKSIFVYWVLIIGVHVLLYVTCLEKGLHSIGFPCMILVSFVTHVLM